MRCCLHLTLDQRNLTERWERAGLDYNPTLLVDRSLTALSAFTLVLIVALVMPNLYLYEVTARYYAWLKPVNQRMEAVSKRLFPGLTGVMPWGERGVQAGGLPNEFLLGAGPEIGRREVMRVRTDEPVQGYDVPPPGHTLRGATFSDYDGHGWHNPALSKQTDHAADQPWTTIDEADRRPLLQSVNLRVDSSILFGAGEPLAPSVDYAAEQRFPGDLVALRAGVRSYTILSQLPALSEIELNALPAWGPDLPLPSPYALYLTLPDSVTERTRQLAVQLTDNQATPYAKAAAIEAYLRQYPYDLTVEAPPEEVADVADYFLFDLKRGYCDYYATAFVVLARLAGLPARFVTGFAPGSWSDRERQWVITEAEAHSWPEVYFPEVGWVPFEPTAGRPSLPRVSRPSASALSTAPAFEPLPPPGPDEDFRPLLWFLLALLPVGAVALVAARWRASREDPWVGLLRWGQRAGRPLQDGQTPLEYGRSLADYVQTERAKEPELGRTVSREVQALSHDVSSLRYAPETKRQALREQIIGRWKRLRMYLRKL